MLAFGSEFETFKSRLKNEIDAITNSFINKKDLLTLKKIFICAIDDDHELQMALHRIYSKIDLLKHPEKFLDKLSTAVNKILKPYFTNEFPHVVSPFLGEEQNTDGIDEAEIKAVFSLNLIAQLNQLLAKCHKDECEQYPVADLIALFNRLITKNAKLEQAAKQNSPNKEKILRWAIEAVDNEGKPKPVPKTKKIKPNSGSQSNN